MNRNQNVNQPKENKMEKQPLVIERTFNAPVEKVWKALTDNEQMKQWYFDIPRFSAEPGFEFTFKGIDHEGFVYIHLCKIREVIPNKKLSYSWRYEKEPGDTLVTFELFPEDGKTRLKLTHGGFETLTSGNPDLAKPNFESGWSSIIGKRLKEYLEKEKVA